MPNGNQFGVIHHISRAGAQKASIITPLYQVSMNALNIFVRRIAQIEEITGVRVVSCAAGLVTFPLFTEGPEAMRFIDLSKDEMLESQALAREMLAVTTYLNYSSKTVLESADVDDK
ncbi:hypothetical protein CEP53_015422 [Fusarium sp. AF-6]|nr:hypothetical protein CEP53_015422 [Fusarium sp. AF-6]